MTDRDLARFVEAQAEVRDRVFAELQAGHKTTHWMWFVFPQLKGLGQSPLAQRYAIADLNQARRYLADPLLGERLRSDVKLMLSHRDLSALQILGSPDDLKFRSCVTLFRCASANSDDQALFTRAIEQFYLGQLGRSHIEGA